MIETRAIDPPSEDCPDAEAAPWFTAPSPFVEPNSESRLISTLRDAAKTRDPTDILYAATECLYRVVEYRAEHPREPLYQPFDFWLGLALADLSVTGRVAYASFQRTPVSDAGLATTTTARLLAKGVVATPAFVAEAVTTVLDRAFKVAWALRGPASQRNALRETLGWIAVSGEDDKPHRPVNARPVSGAPPPFEQFEIDVETEVLGPPAGTFTVRTRFFIASAADDPAPAAPLPAARTLPPDPVPHIPAGHQVILFLHGHSSAAEEALVITPHILKAGLDRGRKYSVVSFDLPNNGYSESFGQNKVADLSFTSWPSEPLDTRPISAPVLDYLENFVVAFVDALHKKTAIKDRFAGAIGGSLGGNLGLRLGQRDTTKSRWLQAGIVSWSPACVWKPMVNSLTNSMAPGVCWDNSASAENDNTSRREYFSTVYDLPAIPIFTAGTRTQPEMWYRDGWQPCKSFQIQGSRRARQEIYDVNFRQWHWRVACEQLIFSHDDHVNHVSSNPWRYDMNTKVPLLLMAGEKDNFIGTYIFRGAGVLCRKMPNTPGRSVFLNDTGHSMHIERPRFVAGQIVDFLYTAPDGLAFCDGQNKVINLWSPTSVGSQGIALLEGTPSRLDDLQVLNRFDHSVQVVAVRVTSPGDGAGAPVFTVVSQTPFNVRKGQSGWIAVRYNGSKEGPLTGFVEVECDDPGDPIARIPFAATVMANKHAELEFTEGALDFGTTLVGTAVADSITITNIGIYDATLAIGIPDQPTGPFTVGVSYPALELPTSLAPGASVKIGVAYGPKDRGAANAVLRLDMKSRTVDPFAVYTHRYEIPLAGTANMPTIFLAGGRRKWILVHGQPAEVVQRELRALDFGVAAPGQGSALSFWIRNLGEVPLTVHDVVVESTNFFGVAGGTFPAIVPPAGEMEVPCSFLAPPGPSTAVATRFRVYSDDPIRVDSGDPNLPGALLDVQGRSGGPKMTEPIEFDQGIVVVTAPNPVTLTFRSDGTDPVIVREVNLDPGTNFSMSSTRQIPAALAPGLELALTVTLTATAQGVYEADLRVVHNGNLHLNSHVRLRGVVQ